jgi:hypothetical protein
MLPLVTHLNQVTGIAIHVGVGVHFNALVRLKGGEVSWMERLYFCKRSQSTTCSFMFAQLENGQGRAKTERLFGVLCFNITVWA